MDLKYIILVILSLLKISVSFLGDFDDLFDSDSDETGFFGDYNYFDYFFPQRKYATGLCYFRLERTYFLGDFRAIIQFDSSTTGLTVMTDGFLAHNGRNNGMTYNIINYKLLTNKRLCIRFEFSYFGTRTPHHSCHQALLTTTATSKITKPSTVLTTTLRPRTTSSASDTSSHSTTKTSTTADTTTEKLITPTKSTTQRLTTEHQTWPTVSATTATTSVRSYTATSAIFTTTMQTTQNTQRTTAQQRRTTTTLPPTTTTLPTRPPMPDPSR